MDQSSSRQLWQGLSIISSRAGKMAARFRSMVYFGVGQESRGLLGLRDARKTYDLLNGLLVSGKGSGDEMRLVLAPTGSWLDRFQEHWAEQNPRFQAAECSRLIEDYIDGEPIDTKQCLAAARYLSALSEAAHQEMVTNPDPAVRNLSESKGRFKEVVRSLEPLEP